MDQKASQEPKSNWCRTLRHPSAHPPARFRQMPLYKCESVCCRRGMRLAQHGRCIHLWAGVSVSCKLWVDVLLGCGWRCKVHSIFNPTLTMILWKKSGRMLVPRVEKPPWQQCHIWVPCRHPAQCTWLHRTNMVRRTMPRGSSNPQIKSSFIGLYNWIVEPLTGPNKTPNKSIKRTRTYRMVERTQTPAIQLRANYQEKHWGALKISSNFIK